MIGIKLRINYIPTDDRSDTYVQIFFFQNPLQYKYQRSFIVSIYKTDNSDVKQNIYSQIRTQKYCVTWFDDMNFILRKEMHCFMFYNVIIKLWV